MIGRRNIGRYARCDPPRDAATGYLSTQTYITIPGCRTNSLTRAGQFDIV